LPVLTVGSSGILFWAGRLRVVHSSNTAMIGMRAILFNIKTLLLEITHPENIIIIFIRFNLK